MRRLALIAVLALASCVETPAGEIAPEGRKLGTAERTACLAKGGTVGRGGLVPDEVCFLPSADGGKSCKKKSDCEGPCVVDPVRRTASCAPVTPLFGCFDFLDETGQQSGICVD